MAGLTWENTTVALGQLKPWANNPRFSTKAQAKRLLTSWKELGQFQTVAIGPECEVYDGHQRLSALLTVYGPDYAIDARQSNRPLTDEERQKLVITAHVGAVGSWDWQALSGWDAPQLQEWGMDADTLKAWNNDATNLKEMLKAEAGGDADAEPQLDRASELLEKWQTEVGQLWAIGNHRILCADCLSQDAIDKLLDGATPDFVFADPPYGVNIVATNGYVGGGEAYNIPFGGVKNRRLGSANAAKPFGSKAARGSDGAAHIVDVGKYAPVIGDETTDTAIKSSTLYLEKFPDAVHVWWGANYYADKLPPSPCWLVWNKETTGNFADCELAWTNQDKAAKLFTHKWNGMLRDSERERRHHPTQKPAALAMWAFTELGKSGDVVLDPFLGSGPTVLAGQRAERRVFGFELSPEYIAIVLERMATAFPELVIERVE